jgi:hypothetical protein
LDARVVETFAGTNVDQPMMPGAFDVSVSPDAGVEFDLIVRTHVLDREHAILLDVH